ncbi:MAG: hypothetical protein GC145_07915 [Caulobacter sp.]|nr:hypothetical protein [Caulobacter sp.]
MLPTTIVIPDFSAASDEMLEAALPRLDGAWSAQTKAMLRAFGLQRLDLNHNWAGTPRAWFCPACRRLKSHLPRPTPAGVLICHLEWHHDHLRDYGKRELRKRSPMPTEPKDRAGFFRAVDACKDITARFFTTLICKDCNAAEGLAKASLKGIVHPDFSFSPTEIQRFITVRPNTPHDVDFDAAKAVWEEVAEDVADRVAFVDILSRRVADGRHRTQGAPPDFHRGYGLGEVMVNIAQSQGVSAGRVFALTSALTARSARSDGFGSSLKAKVRPARTPNASDLEAFTVSQESDSPWRRVLQTWRCEACARDRSEVLRISNAGRWSGRLHRHAVFDVEENPDARWWRNGWTDSGVTVFDHRWVYICQDCRLIITDAKKSGADLSDYCLTIDDLAAVLTDVQANRRHEVDLVAAAARADDNLALADAVGDYFRHRSHVVGLAYRLKHLTQGLRLPEAVAMEYLLEDLEAEHLMEEQKADYLSWLLREADRFQKSDVEMRQQLFEAED